MLFNSFLAHNLHKPINIYTHIHILIIRPRNHYHCRIGLKRIEKTKNATKHFDYYLLYHHHDDKINQIDDIKLAHLKDVNLMSK